MFPSHKILLLLWNVSQSRFFLLLFCMRDVILSLSSTTRLDNMYGNSKVLNYANDSKKEKSMKLHMKGLNDRTKSAI